MPSSRKGRYTVCVYGSSSANTPKQYLEAARKLGNVLADGGHVCVNGAGRAGCMGALNDGVTERCGRVRGVIHEMWIVDKSEHPNVKDLQVVSGEGLQERKRGLQKNSDCIIALPGGVGTWDELWEIVCLKAVGLSNVPICVLDVDDFYEGFKIQILRAQRDHLLYADAHRLLHFESDPTKAVEWCVSQLKNSNGKGMAVHPLPRRSTPAEASPTRKAWTIPGGLLVACGVLVISTSAGCLVYTRFRG